MCKSQDGELLKRCIVVLDSKFKHGFRLDSTIDLRKFKRNYLELNKTDLEVSDSDLYEILKKSCIVFDGLCYNPATIMAPMHQKKLFEYIQKSFDKGTKVIYYDVLMKEFECMMTESKIHNPDQLKIFLKSIFTNYYFFDLYFSKDASVMVDPFEEVSSFMKTQIIPLNINQISTYLSHIPSSTLKRILNSNSEFVKNAIGEYIHVECVDISDKDIATLTKILKSLIEKQEFISGRELKTAIQDNCKEIVERNPFLSEMGWREFLHYKLNDSFSFIGNIISAADTEYTMSDIFEMYSLKNDEFSITELSNFARDMGSPIYYESVFINAIRVSKEKFVNKDQVIFDCDKIDNAISKYCTSEYCSLATVNEYSLFPDCGFPWNLFLLEQYVAYYSKHYKLLHRTYTIQDTVGAIVKKNANIENFDELVIDILVKSGVKLDKENALDYLASNGYIARRAYDTIESLLVLARSKKCSLEGN